MASRDASAGAGAHLSPRGFDARPTPDAGSGGCALVPLEDIAGAHGDLD
jgi:hypothetical protein